MYMYCNTRLYVYKILIIRCYVACWNIVIAKMKIEKRIIYSKSISIFYKKIGDARGTRTVDIILKSATFWFSKFWVFRVADHESDIIFWKFSTLGSKISKKFFYHFLNHFLLIIIIKSHLHIIKSLCVVLCWRTIVLCWKSHL